MLEALPERGIDRFVFASSSSVYGTVEKEPAREDGVLRPASPYGFTKLAAEELVAMYARERVEPVTVLRYFTVYGPRQRPDMALSRFVSAAAQGRPVQVFGDGEQAREMTYVSDVVEATVAALKAPPGTYNVGGGARTTVNGLVELVHEAIGTEVQVEYLPEVAGDVRSTWADLARAERYLGYRPRVDLEEGVAAQIKWTLEDFASHQDRNP